MYFVKLDHVFQVKTCKLLTVLKVTLAEGGDSYLTNTQCNVTQQIWSNRIYLNHSNSYYFTLFLSMATNLRLFKHKLNYLVLIICLTE